MMTNPSEEDVQASAELARLTLAVLAKFNLPSTPENYTLCYEYIGGSNPPLRSALEAHAKDGTLGADSAHELFLRYVSTCNEERLGQVRQEILHLIRNLQNQLHETGGEATRVQSALEITHRELSKPLDSQGLERVISALKRETDSLRSSGMRLQENLDGHSEEIERLRGELELARREAITDPLTGLANRKAFAASLESALTDADARGHVSLLLVDIDHFKGINDTYGHLIGDRVLGFVADALKKAVSPPATAARYGGEEFALILPDAAPDEARGLAEAIRGTIEKTRLVRKRNRDPIRQVTVSVGIATFRRGELAETFIERADRALYAAKAAGRNRVATEKDEALTH